MKICPECQTEYDDTKKFCRHDGSSLEMKRTEGASVTCSQCGRPLEAEKKFCRYCGARVAPKTPTKIELLEEQLAAEPAQVSVMVELADSYLEEGRSRQAVELLKKAGAQQGEDSHIHLLLGKAEEAAGDDDRALDAYLAALARDAWNPEVEAALFREDFLLKTYPRSVEELAKVAAQRESAQMWHLLAQVSEAKGNLTKAVSCLTDAVRVKPDDVASLESLARLCEQRQQQAEAAQWHQRLLEVDPGSRSSHLFFARSHYTHGEYEAAIPHFEQLLASERGNRVYQLYWLLAHVKGYGLHGYESGIAELLQWHELTEEEQPLAKELFVLAGSEELTKEHLARAEQYLLRAHQLSPSQDVTGRLAAVEERKGEHAEKEGDLRQALLSYQRAAAYAPTNETYARQIARVVALRAEENRRRRQAVRRKVAQGVRLSLVAALLIVAAVFGYRKTQEWLQPPAPPQEELVGAGDKERAALPQGEPSPPPTAEQLRGKGEEKPQIPEQEAAPSARATAPPAGEPRRGQVVTATELGIRISGTGAWDPTRSPEAIRQAVEGHFADLQAVYEIERVSDPSLMGSLVLALTIAPDGQTSEIRLQSTKVASKKLQDLVQGLAHEWRFSPASGTVQVAYPLFFLPPGIDAASIMTWERSTAALEAERQPPEITPTPPAAVKPAPEPKQVAKAVPKKPQVKVPLGVYRVITSTPLWDEPRADAGVVTQLSRGIKVRVVGVVGDYLEVRSRRGNPPGYVHKEAVVFVSSQ